MKTHLVWGATSAIGQAVIRRFVAKGDRVIPMLRSPTQAADMWVEQYVSCDLLNPEEVRNAVRNFNAIFVRADSAAGKFASPATAEALFHGPKYQLSYSGGFGWGPKLGG